MLTFGERIRDIKGCSHNCLACILKAVRQRKKQNKAGEIRTSKSEAVGPGEVRKGQVIADY